MAQVPARREYPLLDGLRALAALAVVGYHAAARDGGVGAGSAGWVIGERLNTGVTVFFVLSGFLLYRPFVAARFAGAPAPRIGTYLLRRAARVLPAYWVALTVLALAFPVVVPVFGQHWPVFYLLGQTWVPGSTFAGLSPAWSLSVEVSFYLLLPLFALAVRRLPVRVELALCAVAVVGTSVAFRFLFGRGEGPTGFLSYTVLGHLDWFACGMAMALLSVLAEQGGSAARTAAAIGRHPVACWTGALVVFVASGFVHGNPGNLLHVLAMVVGVLLVLPGVFADGTHGPVQAVLGSAPVRWLGLVSYGIFLWNEPIAARLGSFSLGAAGLPALLLFVLTAAAATLLGAVSFYAIERPASALTRRRQGAPRARQLVGRP